MKILFIADSTSVHTQRWLEYFRQKDHDIYIITIGEKKAKLQGIKHLANFDQFTYKSLTFLYVIYRTRKLINEINPQILHAHFVDQYGWLAALSGFHPFVLTGWGTDILNLPHVSRLKIGRKLTQYTMRKADVLTATSTYLKQEMIKLGASAKHTHVIFWGVDTNTFHPDANVNNLKKKLLLSKHQPVVLSNRNHVALYNNDIVIKAMAKVLKHFPQAALILQNAGGGLENELKQLVRDQGIENSVRFLPHLKHKEMPATYCIADIYVTVPSWDAGPVSLKEAMACGAVPIVSDVPATMEWIKDGINGRVVPKGNIEKLSDAIIELLKDNEKRKTIAKSNIELIRQNAQFDASMSKAEDIYYQILRGNNRKII